MKDIDKIEISDIAAEVARAIFAAPVGSMPVYHLPPGYDVKIHRRERISSEGGMGAFTVHEWPENGEAW